MSLNKKLYDGEIEKVENGEIYLRGCATSAKASPQLPQKHLIPGAQVRYQNRGCFCEIVHVTELPSNMHSENSKEETIHELKIEPKWFELVASGKKKFEIRYDDRGFKVGDALLLREYDPRKKNDERYTGREYRAVIEYIFSEDFGLLNGYVILGIARTGHWVLDPNGMDWNIPAWKCSECGGRNDNIPPYIQGKNGKAIEINPYMFAGSKFCPNCGAKMQPSNEQDIKKENNND